MGNVKRWIYAKQPDSRLRGNDIKKTDELLSLYQIRRLGAKIKKKADSLPPCFLIFVKDK